MRSTIAVFIATSLDGFVQHRYRVSHTE